MNSSKTPLFSGCATAMITPFLPNGNIDLLAFRRLIRMQIQGEIDALVILGTTGEPSTVSMREREELIAAAIEEADGRLPIIVGTGTNNTQQAIEYARQAKALGAQGQLCVTPYYNKATQTGLIRHFHTILDSCDLPMILYHVPGRTGVRMHIQTVAELAKHPQIVGFKEASGDLSYALDLIEKTGNALPLYAGNDDLIVPLMAIGAIGIISVCSNMLPLQTGSIAKSCLRGCFHEAAQAQLALLPLIKLLFSQVSPIPIKAALHQMGCIHDILRQPLTPMEEPQRSELISLLTKHRLIPS